MRKTRVKLFLYPEIDEHTANVIKNCLIQTGCINAYSAWVKCLETAVKRNVNCGRRPGRPRNKSNGNEAKP